MQKQAVGCQIAQRVNTFEIGERLRFVCLSLGMPAMGRAFPQFLEHFLCRAGMFVGNLQGRQSQPGFQLVRVGFQNRLVLLFGFVQPADGAQAVGISHARGKVVGRAFDLPAIMIQRVERVHDRAIVQTERNQFDGMSRYQTPRKGASHDGKRQHGDGLRREFVFIHAVALWAGDVLGNHKGTAPARLILRYFSVEVRHVNVNARQFAAELMSAGEAVEMGGEGFARGRKHGMLISANEE